MYWPERPLYVSLVLFHIAFYPEVRFNRGTSLVKAVLSHFFTLPRQVQSSDWGKKQRQKKSELPKSGGPVLVARVGRRSVEHVVMTQRRLSHILSRPTLNPSCFAFLRPPGCSKVHGVFKQETCGV